MPLMPHVPHAPHVSRVLLAISLAMTAGLCLAKATPTAADARRYVANRRICVKRDTTTLPGYVISTWHKGGRLDSVVTNKLHSISGREQTSPLMADAQLTRSVKKLAKRSEKNREKVLKELQKAIKKAGDEDEAALYQSLVDILDAPAAK